MRQRHAAGWHGVAFVFKRPFGQFGAQPARQFVGLVEIDVEQRNADAQRPDDLDLFFFGQVEISQ
jgi:hypothetical protein